MTNAPEGAFKIPNFIDQLEPAKFGFLRINTKRRQAPPFVLITGFLFNQKPS